MLLGFYPVGQLVMMVFRRPLPAALSPDPAQAAAGAVAATSPNDAAAPPTPALSPSAVPLPTAVPSPTAVSSPTAVAQGQAGLQGQPSELMAILERLEQLERRLRAAPSPEPAAKPAPRPRPQPAVAEPPLPPSPLLSELAALADGASVAPELLEQVSALPRCSTAQAARGLGFRSPASLLNRATLSGYRPGLIKHGANGRIAVYIGHERNDRGGRDRRWWVVLSPEI